MLEKKLIGSFIIFILLSLGGCKSDNIIADPINNDSVDNETSITIPSQLSPGLLSLKLWLDAGSLGLNNNDSVSAWTDRSANGLVGSSILTNPTYVSSAFNDYPAVYLHSDSSLDFPDYSIISSGTSVDIFAVLRLHSSGWIGLLRFTDSFYPCFDTPNISFFCAGCTPQQINSTGISIVEDVVYLVQYTVNGNNVIMRVNGNVVANVTHSSSDIADISARDMRRLGDDGFEAEIAELAFFDAPLIDSDRLAIENYAMIKYGISP